MPLDPTPVPGELRGLRIALLVSGGIAAYKVVDLASALQQAGCEIRVAMTPSATRFVGPTTFAGVTGNPVVTGLFGADGSAEPHVFLGDWAQLILVAPATANIIGRIAGGRSDDVVTATLLAARCPVVVAPAMNDAMWAKPAVQENIAVLRERTRGCGTARGRRDDLHGAGPCGGDAVRLRRPEGGRHRGGHPRADRSGAVHQQLLERQDGIRACVGGGRPGREGGACEHGVAPAAP